MVVLRTLSVAAALALATPTLAAPQVQAAWSRPAAQGTTGAGFMTLANPDKDEHGKTLELARLPERVREAAPDNDF